MTESTSSAVNTGHEEMQPNLKILCVGIACVDSLLVCKNYPIEDSDNRCLSHMMQVGGNAANNCTVLSELRQACEFLGVLSNCLNSNFVAEHFKACGISFENCVYHVGDCKFPISNVIINSTNGSRTIIHYRKNWPEITLNDFKKLDLSKYSWIHFEGRNVSEVIAMIKYVESWKAANPKQRITVSVELEKPRAEVTELLPHGDVVFIGKDYAKFKGYTTMDETLQQLVPHIKPNATLIVPWGELGAVAQLSGGPKFRSPSFLPAEVIDTLGAGDTFCAAVISALNTGSSLQKSIIFGCQVAGAKVGSYGYKDLQRSQ